MDDEILNNLHITDLVWTLHKEALQGKNTDLSIVIGEEKIHCHSIIVCRQNPYIDGLFQAGTREIKLDVAPGHASGLVHILRYFYLGHLYFDHSMVVPVINVALCIKCEKLVEECKSFMLGSLSVESFCNYYATAKERNLQELVALCEKFGRENFSALIPRPGFMDSLSHKDLLEYLKLDDLGVKNEFEVVEAIWIWLDSLGEDEIVKEAQLEELVSQVRISFCEPQTLEDFQENSNVPALLRLKILKLQNHPNAAQTARASYAQARELEVVDLDTPVVADTATDVTNTTDATDATDATDVTDATDDSGHSRIVLVGGRGKDNASSDKITFLDDDNNHKNERIGRAELCNDAGFYAVCFHGDKIIVSGGFCNKRGESRRDVHQFNTRTRRWTPLTDMPDARSRHVALILDQQLFILAGCFEKPFGNCTLWYKSVHALDLASGVWRRVARMPFAVVNASGAAVEGPLILVTGGADQEKRGSQHMARYDPARDLWTLCQSIPVARTASWSSTVAVGRRLFVLAQRDFLAYDSGTDQWAILPPPPRPSYYATMLLREGALVVVGGYESTVKKPHGRIQRYDLGTETWTEEEGSGTTPFCFRWGCVMPIH